MLEPSHRMSANKQCDAEEDADDGQSERRSEAMPKSQHGLVRTGRELGTVRRESFREPTTGEPSRYGTEGEKDRYGFEENGKLA
jgi:hypothetical protein